MIAPQIGEPYSSFAKIDKNFIQYHCLESDARAYAGKICSESKSLLNWRAYANYIVHEDGNWEEAISVPCK